MTRLFQVALLAAGIFITAQTEAQDHPTTGDKIKHDAHVVGHETAKTAVKVGHKTSELAAKGAAAVTDKRYDKHWGPHGEDIYINNHAHYYYVNKLGHRVYVTKSHLRNKPLE